MANNFAKFLSNTAIVDQNERLRSSLERGSFVLDDLQDRFAGWIDRFPITTAVEDLEYGNIGKIVDQDTATLGVKNEDVIYIPANHSDMCKFGDSQDLGYQRISNAIIDQVDSIKQEIERKDHQQRQAAQTQSRGVDFAEELPIRSASGVAPSELPAETESAVQNQIETPIDSAQQKTGTHQTQQATISLDLTEWRLENPVDAQELEEQAAQPEEMIVVEVGIQPSPISLDVYSRLVEDFIDQIKSPSEEFRQGFDRIKNFRKQKTGANEEEGSEQAEAQGKPPPYQAFLGNFHENSRLSQERALYLAALLGRKPMVYKFLQAGINPNSTPDFDFDEVQLTPLGAAIMMHEDDVLQLLLDGGADLRLYYYDPNDNAETADAGAEQLQGDPAPAEETAAKPDEAPAAEQEKSYSRSITCDACGDRIADLEDYYHCGTCRHGNFNICQSCVGNKFSCFGKSVGHTLSKRRVVNGEVQEGGGGELEQESEEVVPELDTSLELPLEALLVTACNGTANATGLILEYGHIQAIPDDLQVVQSTVLLGQAETLEVLIRHGASVDECDQDETTALHYACLKGYQAEAETLLRLGANPNKQDHGLRNALHYAVAGKNEELLKVLLGWESPAVDLEALDEDGDPALMYSATTVGSEKLTLLLLEKGASLKPVNKEGKSLSEQAQAVAGNEENVGMLAVGFYFLLFFQATLVRFLSFLLSTLLDLPPKNLR